MSGVGGQFAVAIGTFDGVHLGHRRVIETAAATGLPVRVLTFDPHPRVVLGNFVEAISTLERRLELLAELGYAVEAVPLLEGVSSSDIRRHLHAGEVREAARLLGRPAELDGIVVGGDQRGGTLGYPTANLAVDPALLVPAYGIYAGAAHGPELDEHRAAISIGTNPHYGGDERRIEPHLLDFEGDLYGRRLVVELWERLRDEQVFANERELVEQIARDVEATRAAVRPT